MQIKTTVGKLFTPTTMAAIKKVQTQTRMAGEEVDKLQSSFIMNYKTGATLEECSGFLESYTQDPRIPLTDTSLRKLRSGFSSLFINSPNAIIHKGQNSCYPDVQSFRKDRQNVHEKEQSTQRLP